MTWPSIDITTTATTPTSVGFDFAKSGIPFVRVQNIVDGTLRFQSNDLYISEETHHALRRSKIFPGDVLISIAGTIGRCAIVPEEYEELNCNQAVAILRTKPSIDRSFLLHWLSSDCAVDQIRQSKVTATISNLSLGQIGDLMIPLPPLDEQKRIAAILDRAADVRRKRQQAIIRFNQLGQAIFNTMFGDFVANDKGWPNSGSLGEYAEIASGITKGRDSKGRGTRPVPYLAVANVQDKRLQIDPIKTIEATEDEIARYKIFPGDLLLTEGGDPDKLGRGTLWNDELPECIHQNHVFRVRLSSDKFLPTFLNWLVGSNYGKQYFLKSAKQTTGIASINSTQLKAFPMLMPPVELQAAFENNLKRLDSLAPSFSSGLSRADSFFQSLQVRAFRGEL
jgi:type I restriction enzyme S subunit